jgi:hypothetical protein
MDATETLAAAAVAPGLTAEERVTVNMALAILCLDDTEAGLKADLTMERPLPKAGKLTKKGQRGLRVMRNAETLPYTTAIPSRGGKPYVG